MGQEQTVQASKRGLSGATLKWIAIITMLIDHTAAVIIEPMLSIENGIIQTTNSTLIPVYYVMRLIGRIAFPIFCFLLVEGFFHTRSRVKYAIRLGVFALVSEIPFDLGFYKQLPYNGHQNVFLTLLIGLLMMMAMQYMRDNLYPKITRGRNAVALLTQGLVFVAAAALATVLHTDYEAWGIIAILLMYVLHFNKLYMCLLNALFFLLFEVTAAISFIPIWFYNGKRGMQMKYFFYVFYPAHLLILYAIYQLCFA